MQSLLDLFLRLLGGDEELVKAYQADPQGFADQHFGDLCDADWRDLNHALSHSGQVERHAESDPGGPLAGNGDSSDASSDGGRGGYEPDSGHSEDHSDDHWEDSAHAIAQLHNIVNNFTQVDDRDVINDQSTVQKINTGGGDFWQRIDNDATIVSGDGAVVAGDDVEGPTNTGHLDSSDHSHDTNNTAVVTGDGNIVGDDNDGNVVGDNNVVGNDFSSETVAAGGDLAGGDIDNSTIAAGDDINAELAGHDIEHSGPEDSFNGWFNGNQDSFNDNSVNDSFNDNTGSFNGNAIVTDGDGPPPPPAVAVPNDAGFDAYDPSSVGADKSFSDNTADSSFSDNTADSSFNDNTVTDSFNNNDVDSSFNDNTVDNSFNHSAVDDSFNHSAVDDSFNSDSLSDDSTTTQSGANLDEVLSHNNVPLDMDVTLPSGF
jgi:hypothetical protein